MPRPSDQEPASDEQDWHLSHPKGSTWSFSWTDEYIVTVTGHTRRGIRVSYKRPGLRHTTKAGVYQPDELVPRK